MSFDFEDLIHDKYEEVQCYRAVYGSKSVFRGALAPATFAGENFVLILNF